MGKYKKFTKFNKETIADGATYIRFHRSGLDYYRSMATTIVIA